MSSMEGRPGRDFGETNRTDSWWLSPLLVLSGLTAFVVYSTWAAFQAEHYYAVNYLSPLYSPVIFTAPDAAGAAPLAHAWAGAWPEWWPSFIPRSPSFIILAFPLSFRLTCYYYRKAYYRAYAATPPACAVGSIPQKKYKGETAFLIFQNLHRYALYFALVFVCILYYDAFISLFNHEGEFGIGVGSVVLFLNATFLGLYTFGCHSFRHLIGGKVDCFSCSYANRKRHDAWSLASILNSNHMLWAWISLFWVGFTDFYVRMVSMGYITDLNTWSGM